MCDPVTLTALGVSAAGSFMQQQEQADNAQRVMDAKNNAYATGMNRQHQYQDNAKRAFNDTMMTQGREAFDTKAQQQSDRMKNAFNSIATPDADYNSVPSSTPKNVITAMNTANDRADEKTNRNLGNLASLSSYGNAMFDQGIDRNKFAQLFGNLSDKASRDVRLLPLEMQSAANNAQQGESILPQLLKYGGMALGAYGAANGINSFGDTVTQGPLMPGQTWADMTSQGLFSKLGNSFGSWY